MATIAPATFFRPPPGSGALASGAWRVLRLVGWQIVLPEPVPLKCVVIVYPHTSNWDFPIGLLAQWALRIRFRWVGKDTMFDTPLRPLYLRWGGIPVNRRERTGFADAMREAFLHHDDFRLVIAPEATRGYVDHWKSGFYHIARAAGMPVALAFIDFARREIGFIGRVDLTGDVAADMARIADLYQGKTGKNPEQQGPIRLREARAPDA
ncbi:MAG: 1-acyl-sn-glycerol-3-phosphate acyltransferase [Betaproteobacteria bacterium]|nr:1-acyl-sn-glycerol-3-phosphate acyltransferase [Betaproteobacteria bacterium]